MQNWQLAYLINAHLILVEKGEALLTCLQKNSKSINCLKVPREIGSLKHPCLYEPAQNIAFFQEGMFFIYKKGRCNLERERETKRRRTQKGEGRVYLNVN